MSTDSEVVVEIRCDTWRAAGFDDEGEPTDGTGPRRRRHLESDPRTSYGPRRAHQLPRRVVENEPGWEPSRDDRPGIGP